MRGLGSPAREHRGSVKSCCVYTQKREFSGGCGGSESKPFRTSAPGLFERVPGPDDGGKGCGGWCSSIPAGTKPLTTPWSTRSNVGR